jgi:hypothetical protein
MRDSRYEPSAVLLPSGRVLISGGMKATGGGTAVNSQDFYDPALDGFTNTDPGLMNVARMGHTASLMSDGTVFFYGGSTDGTIALSSGEIYNGSAPNTAVTFSGTAPLARFHHTATVLQDSRVLLAGGNSSTTIDIISKSAGSSTLPGLAIPTTLQSARNNGHSAIRLNDSRILLVGGTTSTPLAEVGTISGSTASFVATTGAMSTARFFPAATPLLNGNVLVIGGSATAGGGSLLSAEVFNPTTNSFNATATPTAARQETTAVFLFNGNALIPGGDTGKTAELYNPN